MLGSLADISVAGTQVIASSGGFLIEPGIGLMIWTLFVFGATMFLLSKLAFPRISDALGRRQKAIEESIDTAERTRTEAEELLHEYRERLKEARAQAEEIVQRARQSADAHEHESKERAQEILAEAAKRAERDIEAASKRALDDIRKEVADLTVMATEKVTRKTLNEDDQKRLVEEALSELDFSTISSAAPNN
jgi:F-type H+-transporting ATPase subunit b